MKVWIRLLAIVTGIYNFVIGGRVILALVQVVIFAIGVNEIGLPMTTGRLVASIGNIFLIIHSIRLILGFQAAQRLQPWLCLAAIVSRLLIIPIQIWRFPQAVENIPFLVVLITLSIALFDIPLFIVFRLSRVRTAYTEVEAQRKQRQEDSDLQKNIKM